MCDHKIRCNKLLNAYFAKYTSATEFYQSISMEINDIKQQKITEILNIVFPELF